MSYIVVQNYMNLPEKVSNSVPFSWRIKDYLEELWVHTQYITGDAGEPSSGGRGCVLQEETLIPCHRSSPPFESWTTRTPGCLWLSPSQQVPVTRVVPLPRPSRHCPLLLCGHMPSHLATGIPGKPQWSHTTFGNVIFHTRSSLFKVYV